MASYSARTVIVSFDGVKKRSFATSWGTRKNVTGSACFHLGSSGEAGRPPSSFAAFTTVFSGRTRSSLLASEAT
ncbi:MAG: hypothetical protein M5U08_02820 [Burkholderiales bacterium]|nr:hypothetical protein [Burkholderiales bacterium]